MSLKRKPLASKENIESEDPVVSKKFKQDKSKKIESDYSEEEEEEEEEEESLEETTVNTQEDCIKSINQLLKKAKPSGSFASDGEATELPLYPGIEFQNFGLLSLPVTENQAEKLIQICAQAPFGKNYDTVYDKKVRDTYQLEPSLITINNPEWHENLKVLVDRVAKELGCHGKIEAKLYKFLLYQKGGHFLKHKDTEKDKNMFATLVIQLPSTFTGGNLVVYHPNGRRKREIDFGKKDGKNEYNLHYAAHFADLEHELLEVKSGYRAALVYSLCWVHEISTSFKSLDSIEQKATEILSKIDYSDFKMLMLLDHEYTPSSFRERGANALKGIDADRYSLLKNANENLPDDKKLSFYFLHANTVMDKYDLSFTYDSSSDNDDEDDWEENERITSIKEWYDTNGAVIFKGVRVTFDFFTDIINPSDESDDLEVDFDDRDIWCENYDVKNNEYTGNEGGTKTTTYHKYMLVIWPKNSDFDIKLKIEGEAVLREVFNNGNFNFECNEFTDKFTRLLNSLRNKKYELTNQAILMIIQILKKLKNLGLTEFFFKNIYTSFDDFSLDSVFELIDIFGWDSLRECLENSTKPVCGNIRNNCKLAQNMMKISKKETAFEFFKICILPILNNQREFNRLESANIFFYPRGYQMFNDSSNDNSGVNVFEELAEIILLFENSEENLSSFKTLTLAALSEFKLGKLVNLMSKKFSFFKNSNSILEIFKVHLNNLENKLKSKSEFSWSMPEAVISDHPSVQQFLRSDKTSLIYHGNFKSIDDARSFASRYDGIKDNYSATMTPNGTGRNAHVNIVKTKYWYQNKMCIYSNLEIEYKRLDKLLKGN